jgi:hypothetical protein
MTVNPVERLKICINKIKDKQTSDQQKREFIDELCHWSEELDLAKDFFTIGGLDIFGPLLDHSDDQIRMQTCSLLATLVQNNEHCQRIVVQSGLQEKLLKILDQSNNGDLQTKAVTAISGSSFILIDKYVSSFPRANSSDSRIHSRSTAIAEVSRTKDINSIVGLACCTSPE